MGTHPIFESDFDCLTEVKMSKSGRKSMTPSKKASKAKWSWQRDDEDTGVINLVDSNGTIDEEVYISEGVMTARVYPHGQFHIDEHVDARLVDSELFKRVCMLNPVTMDQMRIQLGALVAVMVDNDELTGLAWPHNQVKLGEVALSDEMLASYKRKNNNNTPASGALVELERLDERRLRRADRVFISFLRSGATPPIDEVEIKYCLEYLRKTLTGCYYTHGQTHRITFMGRRLTIRFDKIEADSSSLADLSLKTIYYRINGETRFEELKQVKEREEKSPTKEMIFNDTLIRRVNESVLSPIRHHQTYKIRPARGILLHGQSGLGKSQLVALIVDQLDGIATVHHCEKREHLELITKQCAKSSTTTNLIIFDHFEQLTENSKSAETRSWLAQLSQAMGGFSTSTFAILVTNQLAQVPEWLRKEGAFECDIEMAAPSDNDKQSVLEHYFDQIGLSNGPDIAQRLAVKLHGFVAGDIVALVKQAYLACSTNLANFEEVITRHICRVSPSALKSVHVNVANVKWDDIGGYESTRQSLIQVVEWPLKYPQQMAQLKLSPPNGVLLYGPPGCSKTMVAKALATESGLSFVSIKGAELLSKYVGESEAAVRDIFARARSASPAILFFDEIDAVAVRRGEQNSVVTDRMITTLLTELDGVAANESTRVILVAATNRPHLLDSALLRPGRIDRFEYVPLPNAHARRAILDKMFESVDNGLVERLEGYSGAEIVAVKTEAAYFALERAINDANEKASISKSDIERAMEKVKPRTRASDIELYREFARQNGQLID